MSTKSTSILRPVLWDTPGAVSAKGVYIDLEDGRRVMDGVGGAAVACVGNGVPEIQQAIKDQVDKFAYVFNHQLTNKPAEELAELLTSTSKGAFEFCGFASGGSEAMEAVIKLARQYYFEIGQPQRTKFIARGLSFHGNTVSTLGLAMHPSRREVYKDILDTNAFHHVSPPNATRFKLQGESDEAYVDRLRQELENKFIELGPENVIGFVAETVSGASMGCVPPPKGYFTAMKSVCRKYGALFILDECACGMGRMGTTHAWESFGDGEAPDIQAVAKGLGGGYVPIGAVLMSKEVANGIHSSAGFWKHGHTYQAHPLACAASLAVQKYIAANNLVENCRKQGVYLEKLLCSRLQGPDSPAAPFVFDIRGGGLFWGIDFEFGTPRAAYMDFGQRRFSTLVQARAFEKGLIIVGFTGGADLEGVNGDHLRLSPAYNVTNKELESMVDILVESIEEVLRSSAKTSG